MTNESKPIAVVISDIHFNLNNLSLAYVSLQLALYKAELLNVPLIIAGDLNDSKAIIRAEVANSIIEILERPRKIKVFILEGNHDKINEKGVGHGLNYLKPYAEIIDSPKVLSELNLVLIPYMNNPPSKFDFEKGRILIMHQGFLGAQMGDYVQDKTSISPELVKDFTVISGHYHRHQTIGTVTYIGSPYTITFGEANDGDKGFLILNSDGSFTREILNLRKHIIINADLHEDRLDFHGREPEEAKTGDLIWLKITGPYSLLKKLNKEKVGKKLFGHSNFKLDLIPLEGEKTKVKVKDLTDLEILDTLIKSIGDTDEQKNYLRELVNEITKS